jgi:hypothetical protein
MHLRNGFVDLMGPINPPGRCIGARYIITAIEYLMRWAKARAVKDCSETTTARFIFDDIITRFGCPKILMSDKGKDTQGSSKHIGLDHSKFPMLQKEELRS